MKNIVKTVSVILFLCIITYFLTSYTQDSKAASLNTSISANSSTQKVSELNDTYIGEEWAIKATESDSAWVKVNQKKEIKVAVVDTGVDYTQPDLKNKVLSGLGYNFIDNNSNVMDDNWHGTFVAGIIAAEAGNGQGVAGITGKLDVKIIPVKVIDKDGNCFSDIVAEGIRYAVDKGADIINLSVNFISSDPYIKEAVKYAYQKGVLVVASSGNDNKNCDKLSPAGDKGVYTVAALDDELNKAVFSDYGSLVQISAPGVNIMSTLPEGQFDVRSGTSMAAPIVSGIAAILKAEDPGLKPDDLMKLMNNSASPITDQGKLGLGHGVVNANNAITLLKKQNNKS